MRWLATEKFQEIVIHHNKEINRVAIVGGSPTDPELSIIKRLYPLAHIDFYGIEALDGADSYFLDLNQPFLPQKTYDLVHCAHVVEHLWDVKQAIHNLLGLVQPKGLVWINCPASCRAHGSPDYYVAGYQPTLIAKLAVSLGAKVLESGQFGSRRSYVYEHFVMRWPDRREYESPIRFMTSGQGSRVKALLRWARYLHQRVLATFFSSEPISDPLFSTQTYVALTK